MFRIIVLLSLLILNVAWLGSSLTMVDCINVPTAESVDYGVGMFFSRLYSHGGIISRILFAPFNRLNFGGSIDVEKLVGKEEPVLRDPQFYFKWRVFDGTKYFPAVALGYDGQEYNFSNSFFPAKNIFLVFSKDFKGFVTDFGINVLRYEAKNRLVGFLGIRCIIKDVLTIIAEWENIGNTKLQHINSGLSFLLGDKFSLDLIFMDLYSQEEKYNIDRQVRLNYCFKFL